MVAKYVNETMAEYVNTSGKYVSVIPIVRHGNDITSIAQKCNAIYFSFHFIPYLLDEAPRHGHMFQKSALANCLETFDARNAISLTKANDDYAFSHPGTNITENATNIESEGDISN